MDNKPKNNIILDKTLLNESSVFIKHKGKINEHKNPLFICFDGKTHSKRQ